MGMFDLTDGPDWPAVAVAALAYFFLGALWFSPLFGGAYDRALGVARSADRGWAPVYFVVPFAGSLALCAATAWLFGAADVATFAEALALGLAVGIGCAASVSFTNAVNPKTPRPLLYGAVTGSYHAVGALVVCAILFAIG